MWQNILLKEKRIKTELYVQYLKNLIFKISIQLHSIYLYFKTITFPMDDAVLFFPHNSVADFEIGLSSPKFQHYFSEAKILPAEGCDLSDNFQSFLICTLFFSAVCPVNVCQATASLYFTFHFHILYICKENMCVKTWNVSFCTWIIWTGFLN